MNQRYIQALLDGGLSSTSAFLSYLSFDAFHGRWYMNNLQQGWKCQWNIHSPLLYQLYHQQLYHPGSYFAKVEAVRHTGVTGQVLIRLWIESGWTLVKKVLTPNGYGATSQFWAAVASFLTSCHSPAPTQPQGWEKPQQSDISVKHGGPVINM